MRVCQGASATRHVFEQNQHSENHVANPSDVHTPDAVGLQVDLLSETESMPSMANMQPRSIRNRINYKESELNGHSAVAKSTT